MTRLVCTVCRLGPCACSYIAKLEPGGELEGLREAALLNAKQPYPHLACLPQYVITVSGERKVLLEGQRRETNSCPCPGCYSLRLGSWDATPTDAGPGRGEVTPIGGVQGSLL